jgi:hypothetical protein
MVFDISRRTDQRFQHRHHRKITSINIGMTESKPEALASSPSIIESIIAKEIL